MADADSPLAWTLYLADNRRDILRLLAGIISHMPNPKGFRDSLRRPLSSLPFPAALSSLPHRSYLSLFFLEQSTVHSGEIPASACTRNTDNW